MKEQDYSRQDEQIIDMLTPKVEVKPSSDLRDRILRAAAEQKQQTAPRKSKIRYWIGAATSMAAVVAVAITFMLNTSTNAHAARKYFSQAIVAAQEVKTMIMKLSVRTAPDEPIDYIDPSHDFIPATVKVIYGEPMTWSIEKKDGRIALYKGADESGNYAYNWIEKAGEGVGWKLEHKGYSDNDLAVLLDPRLLLNAELRTAERNKGARYEIIDNGELIIVQATTEAQGNFSESDYMLNTSIAESNTIREYSFAKSTGELIKMRIKVVAGKQTISIIESESIAYNEPLTVEDLYNKDSFSKVTFTDIEFKQNGPTPLAGITADEAAKIILGAMKDWDEDILNTALYFYQGDLRKTLERKYKGLEIKSIGRAFSSGLYAGEFVKCKVVLADGSKETLTLAIRNDNTSRVWLVDGGL